VLHRECDEENHVTGKEAEELIERVKVAEEALRKANEETTNRQLALETMRLVEAREQAPEEKRAAYDAKIAQEVSLARACVEADRVIRNAQIESQSDQLRAAAQRDEAVLETQRREREQLNDTIQAKFILDEKAQQMRDDLEKGHKSQRDLMAERDSVVRNNVAQNELVAKEAANQFERIRSDLQEREKLAQERDNRK
jgi:hypothetical protein